MSGGDYSRIKSDVGNLTGNCLGGARALTVLVGIHIYRSDDSTPFVTVDKVSVNYSEMQVVLESER